MRRVERLAAPHCLGGERVEGKTWVPHCTPLGNLFNPSATQCFIGHSHDATLETAAFHVVRETV
jgi:hypothetical protein